MMPTSRTRIQAVFIFSLLMMAACVEPYAPPASIGDINLFVVDGFINASTKSVNVKLSRAVPLDGGVVNPAEEDAQLTVEDDGGGSISLTEVGEGVYRASELTLDDSKNYRLRIETSDGKSYSSGYVKLRPAAVIDSISWRTISVGEMANWGVQFYVNGHDPANATKYYRYLYNETWEYAVDFNSEIKLNEKKELVARPPSEQIYICWKDGISTRVLTASTRRLTSDIVTMAPIRFIKRGSEELARLYSINVQQMAISEEEYEFREQLKKTTETLGGLFDPLPSQVVGNIQSDSNPDEQVLGYFSGGYVTEMRTFLRFRDLPGDFRHVDGDGIICEQRLVDVRNLFSVGENDIYITAVGVPPIAYYVSSKYCADCTTQGGKTLKPSYWPEF